VPGPWCLLSGSRPDLLAGDRSPQNIPVATLRHQYPQNVNSYDPIGRSRCYLLSKHDHCHPQTLRFISANTFQPSTTARPALRLNTTACATLHARRLPSEARVSAVHTKPTSPAMVLSPMNSRKKESAMPRKWTSTTSRLQTTFLGRTMQRAEWTRILLICTASLLKKPRRFWSSGFGMRSRLGKRISTCKALWLFGSLLKSEEALTGGTMKHCGQGKP